MSLTSIIALVLLAGWLCLAGQLAAALRFARRKPSPVAAQPLAQPLVSVLKPLHGAEPGLYDNLRSFLDQDYPPAQIVLGVGHPQDGALDAARRLIRDFPQRDIALVVDHRVRGSNRKVANLENMLPAAHHDILVLADSDMRVDRRYLAAVTGALGEPGVGLATCLYKGVSSGGLCSEFGALQINFGFLPNALLGAALGAGGCFGATIALSRATLNRIGGFRRVRDELADDHRMGEAVRAQGLKLGLVPYLVEARVTEPSFVALWRHELRWARTVRGVAPLGFAGSVATHPLALALLAAAATGFGGPASALLGVTCVLRLASAGAIAAILRLPISRLWLLPLRDALSFAVFVASFFGRRVCWRDGNFDVEPSGRMTVVDGENAL